ncbi:1-acyl-sn-glycerol-3-phosphate acyltransferase [Paenibacillus sambharensis]|uniref:1-acyl-sn-glycerol-3-phosphate acyltransferase n=1 Tax=Paenibacillus sambharensis TaxID=1803190 RepID=A0A2W1LQ30_9BACL|nr:lysophospholipid acyltransferase family protein [Paenibacillus sambharensis]PZD93507.1 1-acyl-sn-glycerol-3-phosphate acyltransferase [Paenibacillus sambharensis]
MIYRICQFLLDVLYTLLFRIRAEGLEHVPDHGPVLLCSNHISNFDPPAVGLKVRRRVHFMAKAELFSFKPLGALLTAIGAFPVKRGGVSKESIKLALQLLKDGQVMGIFPEGTRSVPGMEGAAKKGAAMIALRSGASVVPVAITGSYRLFGKVIVRYGPPVDLSIFEGDKDPELLERVTDVIMAHIRELSR